MKTFLILAITAFIMPAHSTHYFQADDKDPQFCVVDESVSGTEHTFSQMCSKFELCDTYKNNATGKMQKPRVVEKYYLADSQPIKISSADGELKIDLESELYEIWSESYLKVGKEKVACADKITDNTSTELFYRERKKGKGLLRLSKKAVEIHPDIQIRQLDKQIPSTKSMREVHRPTGEVARKTVILQTENFRSPYLRTDMEYEATGTVTWAFGAAPVISLSSDYVKLDYESHITPSDTNIDVIKLTPSQKASPSPKVDLVAYDAADGLLGIFDKDIEKVLKLNPETISKYKITVTAKKKQWKYLPLWEDMGVIYETEITNSENKDSLLMELPMDLLDMEQLYQLTFNVSSIRENNSFFEDDYSQPQSFSIEVRHGILKTEEPK